MSTEETLLILQSPPCFQGENKGCVEKEGGGIISWLQDAAKSTRVGLAKSSPINSRTSFKKKTTKNQKPKPCCNHKT